MVGCARHTAHTIITSRQTTSDCCAQQPISVPSIVDTLEEDKFCWVRCSGGSETVAKILHGQVGMSDDLALCVEVLRCGVVGCCCVGEGAGLEAGELDGQVKSL